MAGYTDTFDELLVQILMDDDDSGPPVSKRDSRGSEASALPLAHPGLRRGGK